MTIRSQWRIVVPVLAIGSAAVWWAATSAEATPPTAEAAIASTALPPSPAAPAPAAASGGQPGMPLSAQGLAERKAQLASWRQRLDRAQQTLASYRHSTRYPYESRPASEHADQWIAHPTIPQDSPLRMPGGAPAPGVHIHTTQQGVFVSGANSVALTVAAIDDNGNALPLRILSSVTHAPLDQATQQNPPPSVTQPFVDDGTQGDAQPGDNTFTTRLQPATEGFATYSGLVRTELTVQAAGSQGYVAFDVIYSPDAPAAWAGPVRESFEDGSLELLLPVEVAQPGRYVVTGRVDDATGKPFALLTFNEELGAGAQQVKLTVYGKLVRDQKPAFPLRLHDVDGFLLRPDTYPDRALMAARDGVVYTTRKYPVSTFSDDTWSSEETARYLAEFGKDVATAQEQVDKLQQQTGP